MAGRSDFHVDSRRVGDAFLVAPRGDVDLSTADAVQSALLARRVSDSTLVLDLRGVEFLDTTGLRLVVEQTERARADGYRFAVVRGPARVQRIFDVAGLSSKALIVDDPAELTGGDGAAS